MSIDYIRKLKVGDDFELFKSNACHLVKGRGDLGFIQMMEESQTIENCFLREDNIEGFYLLAMIDYLCAENDLPKIERFTVYRGKKLQDVVYPRGILILSLLSEPDAKEKALEEAIPEFLKYNIVEGDIRDVC